jgi:uncharacterized protein YggE
MEETNKKIEFSNRLFVVAAILAVAILGNIIVETIYKYWPPDFPREITISAEGRAFAQPDIASIKIGITTEGFEVKKVVKENTEKMNNVLKEIKKLGIEEKDLQTTSYNLSPRYEWTKEGERIFKGYVLNQELRVKIRNFEKIDEVIEKATENGANLIGEITFNIDDLESVREKAREEAILKAKQKAEKIAHQTGFRLKKIVGIFEDNNYPGTQILPVYKEGVGGGQEAENLPNIQSGEQEIKVKISLVFQIK